MRTSIEDLPVDILFCIFDYLSKNDIIYTFLFLNQRFNNILFQNQRNFSYFELPKTNFSSWKNILSQYGRQIKTLNITSVDTSFPLTYFPNLKSLIISSPYGIPDEEFQNIIDSNLFSRLHSFQLYETKRFIEEYGSYHVDMSLGYPLEKVFQSQSSLKKFGYLSRTSPLKVWEHTDLEINKNLQFLTIQLIDFNDIYVLLSYAPNLQHLNLQSEVPRNDEIPSTVIDVKLKKLSLKFNQTDQKQIFYPVLYQKLRNFLSLFSISLTYLSLNLLEVNCSNINEFPFNEHELQQCLQPMTKLKIFHFVTRLRNLHRFNESTLPVFNSQFWSDHNWPFKWHACLLFTEPYHFGHFHELIKALHYIETNEDSDPFERSVYRENMHICFENFHKNRSQLELFLSTVVTIRCGDIRMHNFDYVPVWVTDFMSNTKHSKIIIGSHEIMNRTHCRTSHMKIQQLDLIISSWFSDYQLQLLFRECYRCFSNVESMHISIHEQGENLNERRFDDIVVHTLKTFKKLKLLTVYCIPRGPRGSVSRFLGRNRTFNEVTDIFDMKAFREYIVFSRKHD